MAEQEASITVENEAERIIEVKIGYNASKEEIEYIESDFMNELHGFKDPVGYTAKLLELALAHWIREKIGIFCPGCGVELQEEWVFCPACGWSEESG